MRGLSQRLRLLILLVYIALLFATCKFALGKWLPPSGGKGLWFYSGLAALILGNLIVTPFYIKPADAISYAVTGIVGLLAVNLWPPGSASQFDRLLWLVTTIYVSVVLVAGIVSIVLKDCKQPSLERLADTFRIFCLSAGTPRSVFLVIFYFSVLVFHRNTPREYLAIGTAGFLLVGLHPLENIASLTNRILLLWREEKRYELAGEVLAHQVPGLSILKQDTNCELSFGELVALSNSEGAHGLGIALDHIGWLEGRWLRILHVPLEAKSQRLLAAVFAEDSMGLAVALPDLDALPADIRSTLQENSILKRREQLIGVVAPDTDISRLRFEIVRTDRDIEEGRLVEVRLGKRMVLYQIINGLTKEEIIQQKNVYGYVRAEARKVGFWNAERKRFEVAKWIPSPNEPVFLVESLAHQFEAQSIGHFPETEYSVYLDIPQLVTHNTAILGILGAGKTFLALELVERMIKEDIKVVCLDLTDQYAEQLAPFYDRGAEGRKLEHLREVGARGKGRMQLNREEGGSIIEFRAAIRDDLQQFLHSADHLKIYNPAVLEAWRQDGWLKDRVAPMASLTPTEITRIIAEALLDLLRDEITDRARVCIVFEEAHSLIPEWSAVASEGDKTATNGTAKAILQGRKHGLGCVVVTQRTANVTKSILNQCNTVFALRVFDATGMEFLTNYVGEDFAAILSTLADRHAVVFGKASSCKNPVMLRLNDRVEFLQAYRAVAPRPAA